MAEENKIESIEKNDEQPSGKTDTPASEKKHTLSNEKEEKKNKRRRRRNYDEYDEEITQEDGKATKNDENENESDVDDEKLDLLMAKEDEEDDDLAEIDTANIITGGRRTRGRVIDYKKTAKALGNDGLGKDDGEDDDDADFDVGKEK